MIKGDISMIDEMFGSLTYDYGYEGKTSVDLFGISWEIMVQINADEKVITDSQRNAYRKFLENESEVLNDVENSIFEYYEKVFESYRVQVSDLAQKDRIAPKINNKRELARIVEPVSLIIDYDFENKKPQRIGFIMETSWDPSHGLGVRIENNKVVEVGLQDVIL